MSGRGPGRPELEPGSGSAPTLSLRVPVSVLERLEEDALRAGVTFADWLRAILANATSRTRPPCPECLRTRRSKP